MATREQLMEALRRADAAGDSAAAQAIARRLQGATAPGGGGSPTPAPQSAPEASQPFQRAGQGNGGFGAVQSGVADAGIRTFMGLKQLFGGLSDEDKAVLEQMRLEKEADPSPGWRTAGDIGANILLTAIPGAKMEKLFRGAAAVPTLARTAAAAAGSSAALEGATAVGKGDTFGEQLVDKGTQALVAGAMGGAITGALGKLSKPFKESAEARQLMDMGITPTLQQGAEGRFGRFVGGMSGGAFAGDVAKRQNNEVLDAVTRRIVPGVDFADAIPAERVRAAGDMLDNEFDQLFQGKKFNMSPNDKRQIWAAARRAAGNEPDVVADMNRRLGEAGKAVRSSNNINMKGSGIQRQRQMLQDQIDRLAGDPSVKAKETRQGLIAAKNKFDELVRDTQLSPEEAIRLTDLNSRYSDFRRLEDAATSPEMHKQFKTGQLLRSYANMDPKGGKGFARGESSMQAEVLEPATRVLNLAGQDDTRAGLVGLRRTLAPWAAAGGVGGAAALSPALAAPLAAGYGISLLGQTKGGAKALFGDTNTQRALADLLRSGAVSPVAAGLTNQE